MARKADPGKRKAIIAAATQIFSRNGYAGTKIVEVAGEAGIGKGTIYEYFRSKEDLFFATFEQLMIDSEAQIRTPLAAQGLSAGERLQAVAETLLKAWLPKLDLYGLVLEFWSSTTAAPGRRRFKGAFQSAYTDFRTVIAQIIQTGIDNGEFGPTDAGNLAAALIGSWDALLLQAWLDTEFDPLAASRVHMDVVLAGLKVPT